MPLTGHPEIRVNLGCHSEERSDVTIPNGIASINAFGIIEAMPLWIATHSFGMLAMTYQAFIYIGATDVLSVAQKQSPLVQLAIKIASDCARYATGGTPVAPLNCCNAPQWQLINGFTSQETEWLQILY